jgi:hypothetical protein
MYDLEERKAQEKYEEERRAAMEAAAAGRPSVSGATGGSGLLCCSYHVSQHITWYTPWCASIRSDMM